MLLKGAVSMYFIVCRYHMHSRPIVETLLEILNDMKELALFSCKTLRVLSCSQMLFPYRRHDTT